MTNFVRLNKIKSVSHGYGYDEDEGPMPPSTTEETTPVTINPFAIKSHYPRKNGRAGTRINFQLGNGFAVSETVEQFEALLGQAGIGIVGTHASPGVTISETQN